MLYIRLKYTLHELNLSSTLLQLTEFLTNILLPGYISLTGDKTEKMLGLWLDG